MNVHECILYASSPDCGATFSHEGATSTEHDHLHVFEYFSLSLSHNASTGKKGAMHLVILKQTNSRP